MILGQRLKNAVMQLGNKSMGAVSTMGDKL